VKPTYFIIGLIFLILSPAVLLYGTVLEKGYAVFNADTQTQDWTKGIPWIGYLVSLTAAVSLWTMIPCFIYGITGERNQDFQGRSLKSIILSFDVHILVLYALVIIILYYLCFTLNAIPPHFPTMITQNSLTIRLITLFTLSLLWMFAVLPIIFPRKCEIGTITEILSALSLLIVGLLSHFLGLGSSYFYEVVGAKLYRDYQGGIVLLLIVSGGISGIFWVIAQIYRGKANKIFEFLQKKSEKVPLLDFKPEEIKRVRIGFEQRSKIFRESVKRSKIAFKVLLFAMVGLASFGIFINTKNLLESIFSVLNDPVSGILGIPTAFLAWYFFSLIPFAIIIVFVEYLRARFRKEEIPQFVSNDLGLDSLVNEVSSEMNVKPPRIVVLDRSVVILETNPMFVLKVGDECVLFVSSEFVEDLRRASDIKILKAAIAHELSHIKNEDVDDLVAIRSLRKSLKNVFHKFSRISFPLVLAFPFSIALLGFLPFGLTIMLFFLFFWLLSKEIIPHLLFPAAVSVVAGIIYYPLAVLLGKLMARMEMRADLEAANIVGDAETVSLMLYTTRKFDKTNLDVVRDVMGEFRDMVEESSWKDYFLKTPGIIIQGMHDYFYATYSNIPNRLKNLKEAEMTRETWRTILGRLIFFLKGSIVDIFINEHCRMGMVLGGLIAPFVFIILFFGFGMKPNYVLSTIYTIAFVFIVAKTTKYAYSIEAVVDQATAQ